MFLLCLRLLPSKEYSLLPGATKKHEIHGALQADWSNAFYIMTTTDCAHSSSHHCIKSCYAKIQQECTALDRTYCFKDCKKLCSPLHFLIGRAELCTVVMHVFNSLLMRASHVATAAHLVRHHNLDRRSIGKWRRRNEISLLVTARLACQICLLSVVLLLRLRHEKMEPPPPPHQSLRRRAEIGGIHLLLRCRQNECRREEGGEGATIFLSRPAMFWQTAKVLLAKLSGSIPEN